MAERANQRVAYHNGRYLPEADVRVPFRDRSFLYGDGCFDMTRTFNGTLFKVKEHVDRLYRSLAYLRIDIGLSPAQMTESDARGDAPELASAASGRRLLGRVNASRAAFLPSATRAGKISARPLSSSAGRCRSRNAPSTTATGSR